MMSTRGTPSSRPKPLTRVGFLWLLQNPKPLLSLSSSNTLHQTIIFPILCTNERLIST